MTTKYIEFASDAAADPLLIALAKAYAAAQPTFYPMPPDSYGPGRQPEPKDAFYQRYYVRLVPYQGVQGGVLVVDDTVTSFNGLIEDGFSINVGGAVIRILLSVAGLLALTLAGL